MSGSSERLRLIRSWSDEQLATELRSPMRASLSFEMGNYYLLFAEALARTLERGWKKRKQEAPAR